MVQRSLYLGVAMLLATAAVSWADGVNCKQVNKYLQTGRSVSDVAETMVIGEDDVKKCQEEAAAQKAAGGGEQKTDGQKEAK